jgi:hypothetical protein
LSSKRQAFPQNGAPHIGFTDTLTVISAIAACSIAVASVLIARPAFIVSPESVDPPTPESAREETLVRQINQISDEFTPEFWRSYRELRGKLEAEVLVPDGPEQRELIRMSDRMELRHAHRLELLIELAKLRKTSLVEVMKHSDVVAQFRV